jgi:adenylyltransferase/sulfurtransferase
MRTTPQIEYSDLFAAQAGVLGMEGQERLRCSHVAIIGAGGIGTATSMVLASAGLGRLTVIDPQCFAPDNFNRSPFARESDVGIPKVELLARFFDGRAYLSFKGIVAEGESSAAAEALTTADVIISASNRIDSRLAAARVAREMNRPHIGAGVADSRLGLAGFLSIWLPERCDLACQACYLSTVQPPARGESLMPTVVSVMGGLAADVVVKLLAGWRREAIVESGNLLVLDLDVYTLNALTVLAGSDCALCRRPVGRRHR